MKKNLLFFAKLAVSISLLVYLFSIADVESTFARLRNIEVKFVVAAFLISIGMVMLSALKWKFILRADDLDTPYLSLLQSYYIGNFLGLFLPSAFGGDIYRVYALSSVGKDMGKVTSSVLFDRITGLFALLSISLFGYLALPDTRHDLFIVLLYLTGIVTFFMLTSAKAIEQLQRYQHTPVRYLIELLTSFRSYRFELRTFLKIIAIAFVFQFLIVINNTLYTLALSIDIPFRQLVVIIPLVFLTEALPISVNGAGVRDSAFVFFFVMLGHTKEEGLAIGLLVIAMRYIGGLVGGSVLVATVLQKHLATRTQNT